MLKSGKLLSQNKAGGEKMRDTDFAAPATKMQVLRCRQPLYGVGEAEGRRRLICRRKKDCFSFLTVCQK